MPRSIELPLGLTYERLTETQSERASIRQLLSDGLDEEHALQHEVDVMQGLLRDFQDLLSQQRWRNQLLASLVAPIRRLPVEILLLIFEECVRSDRARPDYFTGNATLAPFVLQQVCSLWRTLVNRTPPLWNNLVLRPQETRGIMGQLYYFLDRSAQLPVHLTISPASGSSIAAHIPSTFWYLFSFRRFSSAVETLVLNTSPGFLGAYRLPNASFRRLHTLRLDLTGVRLTSTPSLDHGDILNLFFDSPQLVSLDVTIGIATLSLPLYATKFPWQQLLRLRLEFPSDAAAPTFTALDILARCTSLMECTLEGLSSCASTAALPGCRLSALTRLAIPSGSMDILSSLLLPNLQQLSLNGADWTHSALMQLHARSDYTLNHLEVSELTSVSTPSLEAFLEANPSIEGLRLCYPSDQAILQRLTWRDDTERHNDILPRLRSLFMILSRCCPPPHADSGLGEVGSAHAGSGRVFLTRVELELPHGISFSACGEQIRSSFTVSPTPSL
ncbi:hypothetical protein C8F01DRAFT_1150546 [Mycena amicta]|nr:hypothetical protein C8F01DRAFT_1150546 [Mycena amicta]